LVVVSPGLFDEELFMSKDIFHEREAAEEAVYFRQQDEKLIEKIRAKAKLAELAAALADKLQVDDPQLLQRIVALGVTRETGSAFLLLPLVQVAWADGKVTHHERDAVLNIGARRGLQPNGAEHAQVIKWLGERPSEDHYEAALEAIRIGLSVLPPAEARERVNAILDTCREVATAAGALGKVLHLHGMSAQAQGVMDHIKSKLEVS
jgi:hypothetical protein